MIDGIQSIKQQTYRHTQRQTDRQTTQTTRQTASSMARLRRGTEKETVRRTVQTRLITTHTDLQVGLGESSFLLLEYSVEYLIEYSSSKKTSSSFTELELGSSYTRVLGTAATSRQQHL